MINRRLAVVLGSCIAFVILLLATGVVAYKPVTDYSTLLQYLRDSGASVVDKGELSWFFFYDVKGRRVTVNEVSIDVHEYDNAGAMEAEARCVSPDGYGIKKDWGNGTGSAQQVSWICTPHFYKAGRVIVFYCGDNVSIISLLRNGLGRQFAGR